MVRGTCGGMPVRARAQVGPLIGSCVYLSAAGADIGSNMLVVGTPVATRLITSGTHVCWSNRGVGTAGRRVSSRRSIVRTPSSRASGKLGLKDLAYGAAGTEAGWDGGEHRHRKHRARYHGE
jgi:hypothetical protein